jgi:hypothetical protein
MLTDADKREIAAARERNLSRRIPLPREFRPPPPMPLPAFADIKDAREAYDPAVSLSRNEHAVYFLFRRWVLLYIGMTNCVDRRLADHREDRIIPFTAVSVLACENCTRYATMEVEKHFIWTLRPRYNDASKPFTEYGPNRRKAQIITPLSKLL